MTLGEKLRRTRQERGLTQKQLAGERITRNMLSQIENDLAQPSMRTLEYLADALGVEPGWLMMQEQSGDAQSALTQARELLREGAFAACLAALEPLSGEEALLMRAICARSLAAEALDDERFEEAKRCAEQALSCSAQCLYPDAALQVSAAGILARCAAAEGTAAEADAAFETYRETYLRWQSGVGYHLTLARFDLEREHVQAAEREIWSMSMPTGYVLDYPRWLHIWCHKNTAVIDLVVHGVHMTRKIVVRSKNTTFSGCGHAILSFFLGLAVLVAVTGAIFLLFFSLLLL